MKNGSDNNSKREDVTSSKPIEAKPPKKFKFAVEHEGKTRFAEADINNTSVNDFITMMVQKIYPSNAVVIQSRGVFTLEYWMEEIQTYGEIDDWSFLPEE